MNELESYWKCGVGIYPRPFFLWCFRNKYLLCSFCKIQQERTTNVEPERQPGGWPPCLHCPLHILLDFFYLNGTLFTLLLFGNLGLLTDEGKQSWSSLAHDVHRAFGAFFFNVTPVVWGLDSHHLTASSQSDLFFQHSLPTGVLQKRLYFLT